MAGSSAAAAIGAAGATIAGTWATRTTARKLYDRRVLPDLGTGVLAHAVAILGWDFIYYWNHRFMHETRWLWAIHVVHHSSEHYNLSTALRQPVLDVVGDRLLLSFVLNFSVILFTWAVAFPIGFYAATHQYSWGDHGLSFIGYLGLATPNFLLALVLMYFATVQFGLSIGGLMDPQYLEQPMSWPKFMSVLSHLWIPVIVIGTSGTAGMIRRLRANLLDELQKQYVVTARAKGMGQTRLLVKYPLRMALNPFIADIGNLLPSVISGSAIVSVVLSLQTEGPMLLDALQSQDQYLAGSFLMFLALLTVMGVFVSDLLLAVLDPRIRLGGEAVQ